MNTITRGMRNAFRNGIRTTSIVLILALSLGLALTMVVARQAVDNKITSVKSSIGNAITVSPAGARGFEGGGEPLTASALATVKDVSGVASTTATLQDRLTTTSTSLVSAIEAGTLGRRFGTSDSSSSTAPTPAAAPTNGTSGAQAGPGGGMGGGPGITLIGTNSLSGSVLSGGGTVSLKSGADIDPASDTNDALVGATLATKNGLSVGSTFTVYGTAVTVAGIYDSGSTFSNNSVIMPLASVQRLSSQTGELSSITVQPDSIDDTDAVVAAIKSGLGTGAADVTSAQSTAADALAPLESIKTVSTYSLIGAVAAGAVIILLTMMMIVRERRREIGILKAIGSSNAKVVGQFVTEAVTFTAIAAVIGIVIGVLASGPVTNVLVSSSSNAGTTQTGGPGGMGGPGGGMGGFAARAAGLGAGTLRNVQTNVGWDIILYGLGAAILIAILGSAIPALAIAKVRPAEVMRAE